MTDVLLVPSAATALLGLTILPTLSPAPKTRVSNAMSAIGSWRTSLAALHVSAFGSKADNRNAIPANRLFLLEG